MNRRISLLVAVVTALALAAPAVADRVEFGTGLNPTVAFTAKLRGNEVINVKKFVFRDVQLTCDQGTLVVDNEGEALPKIGVNNNRFNETFSSANGQKVDVSGEFSNKGKKAEGKLRIRGDFIDPNGAALTNCDSGKVRWKAGA